MRLMRVVGLISLLMGSVGLGQVRRTPVVVELFTSEGCSSCPPADALLAKLEKEQPVAGAEILVLEEHVDYWEGLGWHDRFSSAQFTERQKEYGARFRLDDVFTPQMVVAGTKQFVGSDAGAARRAIEQAAAGGTIGLTLTGVKAEGRRVSGIVGLDGAAAGKGELYVALVQASATTEVRGGENGGRTLRHVGVVRAMSRIGSLQGLVKKPVAFSVNAPEAMDGMRVVVFAQGPDAGPIVGAVAAAVR